MNMKPSETGESIDEYIIRMLHEGITQCRCYAEPVGILNCRYEPKPGEVIEEGEYVGKFFLGLLFIVLLLPVGVPLAVGYGLMFGEWGMVEREIEKSFRYFDGGEAPVKTTFFYLK